MSLEKYNIFSQHLKEIANDKVLRIYGMLLSLGYIYAILTWLNKGREEYLAVGQEGICWPHFPECYSLHILSLEGVRTVWYIFAIGAGLVALGFALAATNKFWARLSYFGLWALEATRIFFVFFSDFRFQRNQHYMHFMVVITLLFVPKKRKALTFLIPFFYFFAGLLKVNTEWLSGATLEADLWIFTGKLLPWAMAYVVVLELVFIWAAWARGKLFWFVFLQLFLFHLWSFNIVGFYYPILMYSILSIFIMDELSPDPQRWIFANFKNWRNLIPILVLPTLLFCIHLYSAFVPGDKALTGETRTLTLNMFDAAVHCDPTASLRFRDPSRNEVLDLTLLVEPRLACDPILFLSRARTICHNLTMNTAFIDVDLLVKSKRASDEALKTVVNITDFCKQKIGYSYLGFNSWIQH